MNEPNTVRFILFFLIPAGIVAAFLKLPAILIAGDTSSILTVTSLVFAILVGFFIATATTNYLNFQQYLADESAKLVALFKLGAIAHPSMKEALAEGIDDYVIAALDFSLTEYVGKTTSEFGRLMNVVDELEPETEEKRRLVALDHLYATKVDLYKIRESIALAALRVIKTTHWLILVALASVLVLSLLVLRTDQFSFDLILSILSVAVYFILLLLYEIDNNTFLQEHLAYQDTQETFAAIGRLPYFPSFAVSLRSLKNVKGKYRVGVYRDYPRSLEKKIEIRTKPITSNH